MKGIFSVVFFLVLLFMLFAIIGLQNYEGDMYYTCRMGEKPETGAKVWPKYSDVKEDETYATTCNHKNKNTHSHFFGNKYKDECPEGSFCGSPLDFGLDLVDDGIYSSESIMYGVVGYDNILKSFITVF